MSALGLIFSNIHDNNVPELTSKRTVASIPFCGRYRLIDFALSNMVNSDINKVGVITKSNFQSLMDHLGSGKDWDLARHVGGLYILPPFGVSENNKLYKTRLEALKSAMGFLTKSHEEYVIMSDSDMICTVDFKPILAEHISKGSEMTLIYVKKNRNELDGKENVYLDIDENNTVKELLYDSKEETVNFFTNMVIISRNILLNLLNEAISHGASSFLKDVVASQIRFGKVRVYEHKGYYEEVTSLQKYYDENMSFLNKNTREEVFRKANIYTKVKDSTPTHYGDNAIVQHSLIADGCKIEGEVYNSIIFRGVSVGRGTVIKNSIVMQNTTVGEQVSLNCIITDKNVLIKDKRNLSSNENYPFYISKGTVI